MEPKSQLMHERPIYLDCAATTPVDPTVADLVYHIMTEEFGNAGSRTHIWGTEAKRLVEKAREQVAAVLEASPDEIIFTSGATEANNMAILGLTDYGLAEGRRHIISTQIEHKAVLEPLSEMERRGFEVTLLPCNHTGWVRPESVAAALRQDTLLVSIMQVNNETGIIQPIAEICEVLKSHPAYFHVDAAQGFGKEMTVLRNKRIDLISISGHKIFAPKGVGALITRRRNFKRAPLKPIMFGGGQEFGLRSGTLPVPLVAGLGHAAHLSQVEHAKRREYCTSLGNIIVKLFQEHGFTLIGDQNRRTPGIVCMAHKRFDSESIILALRDNLAFSNGAACSSATYTTSHVLQALGIEPDLQQGAIRLSWSHLTSLGVTAQQLAGLTRLK